MVPRSQQQSLRGLVLGGHRNVLPGRGDGERVVPAAGVHPWDVGHFVKETLLIARLLRPELVVLPAIVVVEKHPLQIGDNPQWRVASLERRRTHQVRHVLNTLDHLALRLGIVADLLAVVSVQEEGAEHVQAHGAPLARLVGEYVGRRYVDPHRAEMWGSRQRGHVLNNPSLGAADHSNLSVRPVLDGYPLDGVVAVLPLVDVSRVVVLARALGVVPSPHVLKDHNITSGGEEVRDRVYPQLRPGLVVRGAPEDCG